MAAATVTATKLEDSYFHAKYHVRVEVTDTQVSSPVTIIDASALRGADADADFNELQIESVDWNSSDVDGILNLLFNATSDQTAFSCIGYRGGHHGARLKATTSADGYNGDIQITTSAMGNPSTLELFVTVRKAEGFLQQPRAEAAYITDEVESNPKTLFVTGDIIHFSVPFSDQVHVTPVPELEVKIQKESTPDVFHTFKARGTNQGNQSALTLEHTITDENFGELETVSLGDLLAQGAAKITGGFGNRPAILEGFDASTIYEGESEDIDDVEINPNRIIAAEFSNDGASEEGGATDDVWFEGDNVTLVVTFGQPQDVTLDDDSSDIKVVVTGDTGSVDFDYVSGSGTRQLTFAATIPVSGTAQGEASEVDLTAGINLVEDDAIESTLTGVEPSGVSDQDWSDLITVASLAINPAGL